MVGMEHAGLMMANGRWGEGQAWDAWRDGTASSPSRAQQSEQRWVLHSMGHYLAAKTCSGFGVALQLLPLRPHHQNYHIRTLGPAFPRARSLRSLAA